MTDEKLDAYEAKLRKGAQPSSLGLFVYALLALGLILLGEGLSWLFWSRWLLP